MAKEQNIAAQERMAELINSGETDRLDEVLAADVVDHDPAPDQGPGVEGFESFFATLRTAFPDLHFEPAAVVADDEHVALAYTITGTHQGPFQGLEPSGQRVEARGMQIGRFVDGKIVERWGSSDELGMVQALGAVIGRPA